MLTDIVDHGLDLLLVAINPSPRSVLAGHSFASPGNAFWRLLHLSGLTPVEFAPCDERRLLESGIGLVSTVRRPTAAAVELGTAELRAGADEVRGLVVDYRPRLVGLLGLTLAPFFAEAATERGPGLRRETLEGAGLFVLPNPSGRNRAYPGLQAKLIWYTELARHVASAGAARRSGHPRPGEPTRLHAPMPGVVLRAAHGSDR